MQIKTTARHFEMTPGLKEHVEDRLARLTKYSQPILEAHVVLSVEKYRHTAEITLHGNGTNFAGNAQADDMYAAVDEVCSKLETQVKRHKEKRTERKTRKTRAAQLRILNASSVGQGDDEHDVITSESVAIRTMSVDEAILEMESSKNAFVMFENAENDRMTVVYRRPDGHFGVIEPA
ncbi:MAG: ribosome hibernation-promoting factor, HPF/YfiA family [bacterium]